MIGAAPRRTARGVSVVGGAPEAAADAEAARALRQRMRLRGSLGPMTLRWRVGTSYLFGRGNLSGASNAC